MKWRSKKVAVIEMSVKEEAATVMKVLSKQYMNHICRFCVE